MKLRGSRTRRKWETNATATNDAPGTSCCTDGNFQAESTRNNCAITTERWYGIKWKLICAANVKRFYIQFWENVFMSRLGTDARVCKHNGASEIIDNYLMFLDFCCQLALLVIILAEGHLHHVQCSTACWHIELRSEPRGCCSAESVEVVMD